MNIYIHVVQAHNIHYVFYQIFFPFLSKRHVLNTQKVKLSPVIVDILYIHAE